MGKVYTLFGGHCNISICKSGVDIAGRSDLRLHGLLGRKDRHWVGELGGQPVTFFFFLKRELCCLQFFHVGVGGNPDSVGQIAKGP